MFHVYLTTEIWSYSCKLKKVQYSLIFECLAELLVYQTIKTGFDSMRHFNTDSSKQFLWRSHYRLDSRSHPPRIKRLGQITWWVQLSVFVPKPQPYVKPDTLSTNLSAWAGYDTRSIFKRSLPGLNSEFSFS